MDLRTNAWNVVRDYAGLIKCSFSSKIHDLTNPGELATFLVSGMIFHVTWPYIQSESCWLLPRSECHHCTLTDIFLSCSFLWFIGITVGRVPDCIPWKLQELLLEHRSWSSGRMLSDQFQFRGLWTLLLYLYIRHSVCLVSAAIVIYLAPLKSNQRQQQ